MTTTKTEDQLRQLALDLKMLLLDVDGVMTDGGIILSSNGDEAKRFDVQDGMGITLLKAAGVKIGIITSRDSTVVKRRAEELKIDEVFQGARRKIDVLPQILEKYAITPSQAAYIGDDIQDIPIMKLVGVPIAVQNAMKAVKECSVYVTENHGGHGAVREAIEWLLDLRGEKEAVYQSVTG